MAVSARTGLAGSVVPVVNMPGQYYRGKCRSHYRQHTAPVRQCPKPPGKLHQDGSYRARQRDLDPGASPLHFFGAEVRRAREAAGMTLADLGATVPCDASTVSKIEAGLLRPTKRFVAACVETFPQMEWLTRF